MFNSLELMKHFRVFAIDHLGFGKSDRPDFNFDDFENSMNFFVLPIVQIVKLLDLRELLIIGHSYSGLISAHLVPRIKDRILGVWLFSPAGFNKREFSEYEKKKLLQKMGKQFQIGTELAEFLVYLTFEKVGDFSSKKKLTLRKSRFSTSSSNRPCTSTSTSTSNGAS